MNRALVAAAFLAGCGGAAAPALAAPDVAPSTHRDPPSFRPLPEPAPATGALVGIRASGGENQAREVLVRLVGAVQDGDGDAIEELLAPAVFHLASLRPGARARAAIPARAFAQQLLTASRIGLLRADARFEDLVDPDSVRIEPVEADFPRELPPDLRPGDLVVRFALAPEGRRALQMLAPDGRGSLVVRPGERAQIVAR
jgi:hypothetical protein